MQRIARAVEVVDRKREALVSTRFEWIGDREATSLSGFLPHSHGCTSLASMIDGSGGGFEKTDAATPRTGGGSAERAALSSRGGHSKAMGYSFLCEFNNDSAKVCFGRDARASAWSHFVDS